MRIDVFHHIEIENRDEVLRRIDGLELKLDLAMETIMPTLDELNAKADQTLADVRAETDLNNAIAKVVTDQNDTIKGLREQLAAAGTDQAKLDKLGETMDQILATNTANTKIVSDAVTANTQAEPQA